MTTTPGPRPGPRLWPLWVILGLAAGVIGYIRLDGATPFQDRNISTVKAGLVVLVLSLLWWLFFSRVRWSRRLLGLGLLVGAVGLTAALFRVVGVSGDLLPIWEPRWRTRPALAKVTVTPQPVSTPATDSRPHPDFPQYLGPTRDSVVTGIKLDPDWTAHPPGIEWRIPVGSAWSGFVIVGERALTQEQRGEDELVTCRSLADGKSVWEHTDPAKYDTVVAGAGPRQTPVVVGNRVYTLGATGVLNCLDLATGQRVWGTNLMEWANAGHPGRRTSLPDWGYAGSPLVTGGRVIVQAGGDTGRSLVAFDALTGTVAWSAGDGATDYGSPTLLNLGGTPQVLIFSRQHISAHDLQTGRILWHRAFGSHYPLVANPLAVGPNRVLLTAGYGVGAELLDVSPGTGPEWTATSLWKSVRLKAKFHHPVQLGDYVYGLDDGIWACVKLADGTQPWKAGRYGHGQGLLVGEHYLLMAEGGELVLLRPTPDAPNELGRYRVFNRKTWNPIALSGNRLLVRNDEEAVLLKVALR